MNDFNLETTHVHNLKTKSQVKKKPKVWIPFIWKFKYDEKVIIIIDFILINKTFVYR